MSGNRRRNRRNRRAHMAALYRLQAGVCYLCPDPMRQTRATADHVVPRCQRKGFMGRVLLAHQVCNARKADRAPHPCELIYLEAVTFRLAAEDAA